MFASRYIASSIAARSFRQPPAQLSAGVLLVPSRGVSRARRQKRRPNRNAKLGLVLRQDVEGLGVQGQHVEVKHGFGRNHLIPKGMAVYATPENRATFEVAGLETTTKTDSNAKMEKIVKFLQDRGLEFHKRKEFALTEEDLVRECKRQLYLEVPAGRIDLEEPISSYGEHRVPIAVDVDVSANLKVFIRQ